MMKMIQIHHPVIRTINRIIYLKINKIKIVYGLGKVTQNQLKRNVVRKIKKLVEEYITIVPKHVVKLVKDHVVSDRWTKRNETMIMKERKKVLKRIQEIQVNLECVLIELQQLHTYTNTIFNIDLNKIDFNTNTHTHIHTHITQTNTSTTVL